MRITEDSSGSCFVFAGQLSEMKPFQETLLLKPSNPAIALFGMFAFGILRLPYFF
jgi:hypothetical protein